MLNERQKKFAADYVKHGNATKAAISAGYSEKTAHQIGHQLLKHPSVAAKITSLGVKSEKKDQLNAELVVETLRGLVSFDIASCYDDEDKLLPINKMPLEARNAIASIDGGKIKFISRLGSVELAAKILQLVKQEQTQQQAVQIIIASPVAQPVERVQNSTLLPEWE